jgi:transcriptional regulator with XRE-family HTH domain
MSEYFSLNPLREEFLSSDEEYRYAYAEDFLNTYIATQIKVLRDKRGKMTQKQLADAIGTQQPGIARLENVNYSKWKVETLKKVARALGVRLKISFETFGSLLEEDANFSREALERPPFEEDPAFKEAEEPTEEELSDLLAAPSVWDMPVEVEVTYFKPKFIKSTEQEAWEDWRAGLEPIFGGRIPAVIVKGRGTGEELVD